MRKFTGIDFMTEAVPDETTLCKFRHLLEENGLNKLFFDAINRVMVQTGHMMKGGTIVDATIINAPSSTKTRRRSATRKCIRRKEEDQLIGIWGQRHLRYLKKHRRVRYANLLTSGELNAHLADVDRQAEELFLRLVKQMANAEGITETLKANDQMEWVGRMNSCRDCASETVYHQVIYT